METIESWGRLNRLQADIERPRFASDALAAAASEGPWLAIGLGRSYGDVGLTTRGRFIALKDLDRFISFDAQSGVLTAQCGVSLSACLAAFAPRGWFLPTTPGSRFVTLGGAVANDVHGKNHHRAGSIGRHIRSIGLARSDGQVLTLSPAQNADLFAATVGGLGLTGVILWVELQLERVASTFLDGEKLPFGSVEEFLSIAAESAASHEHTVAWVDCLASGADLGRGVFGRANWAKDSVFRAHDDRQRLAAPFDAPGFALNGLTVRAFNALYRRLELRRRGPARTHYAPFFYPLDSIGGWNRMYGSRGFFQHQCVTPIRAGAGPVRAMLEAIAKSGEGSFLAVLKTFGDLPSPGMLSFPMEGITLALDFPNRGARTEKLFERLDAIVAEAGGRLYPAKDARMPRRLFEQGYPRLDEFRPHRDPSITSDFAERVLD